MDSSNDNYWATILTLLRIYMHPIACALFHMIHNCIVSQQRSDDPLRQQEEGRLHQGCSPWDDEYSDEEDDEVESIPGVNHDVTDEKNGEQRSVTTRECKGG